MRTPTIYETTVRTTLASQSLRPAQIALLFKVLDNRANVKTKKYSCASDLRALLSRVYTAGEPGTILWRLKNQSRSGKDLRAQRMAGPARVVLRYVSIQRRTYEVSVSKPEAPSSCTARPEFMDGLKSGAADYWVLYRAQAKCARLKPGGARGCKQPPPGHLPNAPHLLRSHSSTGDPHLHELPPREQAATEVFTTPAPDLQGESLSDLEQLTTEVLSVPCPALQNFEFNACVWDSNRNRDLRIRQIHEPRPLSQSRVDKEMQNYNWFPLGLTPETQSRAIGFLAEDVTRQYWREGELQDFLVAINWG
ncbi:hypothetical protein B0H17DRAFT_1180566 [Mycena rosella]|uniref:Uncharacterized protein n=1 Tax=Mycena rosella TaxID=1033263 RepID=A0AAD7GHM2_MYCRO|nr:hypothetical protein B0H17DRAFT_1180566 [Mycena rosella]